MSALDESVRWYVALGWDVESRTDTQVVMVRRLRKYSAALHWWLGLATCTVWWWAWAVWLGVRSRRLVLTLDPATGQVWQVRGRRGAADVHHP